MDRLTVTLEGEADLTAQLEALGEGAPRAITRALNRTGATGRTLALRQIARRSRLPQRRFARNVILRRATFSMREARVEFVGRPIPLSHFLGALRVGRRVRIPTGLTVQPEGLQTPFIQQMPRASRPSVFARRGQPRLPIAKLFGPSVPELIAGHVADLAVDLRPILRKNLEHEIAFLAGGGRPAPGGDDG
jgi:hypothetical protein